MSTDFDVTGLEMYDVTAGKTLKYIYPDTPHWTAGWILYKLPEGGWATYRQATDQDIAQINKAVATAHHSAREGK
jgi:hypothetical protein